MPANTPITILFEVTGIAEAKRDVASVAPEFKKIETAATSAGTKVGTIAISIKQAGSSASSLTPVAQNLDKIKTSTDSVVGSYQKYSSEGVKVKTTTEGIVVAADKAGSSNQKVTQSFDAMASSSGKVTTSAASSSKSLDAMGSSSSKLSETTKGVTGGLNEQMNVLQQVSQGHTTAATSADKNSASHTSLKSSFAATMGSAAALGGGIISLWQSYDSLSDAQLRVDKATNTLTASQLKVQSLQIQLNKLTADGKVGTEQYALVQDKLTLATEKVNTTEGTLQNAQEDLNVTQARFYQEIIPQGITVLGSLTALLTNGKQIFDQFSTGITGSGTAMRGLDSVMKLISLSNPFFLALIAGTTLLTLFVTNLFGFRDALNAVGVAIGNAVQPLKPFLTMIGSLGEGLVNALGQGSKATKAFGKESSDGLKEAGDAATDTGEKYREFGEFSKTVIMAADGTIAGFTTDFGKNMGSIKDSSGLMSSGIGTASSESVKSMNVVIEEAKKVAQQLEQTFTGTAKLQGLNVTGLPKYHEQPHKLGTGVEGDKPVPNPSDIDALRGLTLSKLGIDELNTGFGTTLINIDKLREKLTSLGVPANQVRAVADQLTASLHLQGIAEDYNASGFDLMTKTIEGYDPALALNTSNTDKNAKANNLLAGTTAGVDAATKKNTASLTANNGIVMSSVAGRKTLDSVIGDSDETLQGYTEILGSEAAMHDVTQAALARQQGEMKKNEVNVIANAKATQVYSDQLNTTEGGLLEISQGFVKEETALNAAKAAALGNVGALIALTDETKMADAQNVAMLDGYIKTELALKNTQIATAGTIGEVAALRAEWARGEAQTVAFNKGQADQAKAFELARVAGEELRGKLAEMTLEWERGESQNLAYNTAITEQKIKFEEDRLAMFTLKATLTELTAEWNDGKISAVAFTTAFYEQETQALKNRIAIESLKGTYSALVKEYDSGLTTFNATQKGYEEQLIAIYKNAEASDQLTGTIKAMDEQQVSHIAQLGAFITGYTKQEAALRSAKVATEELHGTVASLATNLELATTKGQNYTAGKEQERKVILDSYTAYQTLLGTMDEYQNGIESLLPQSLAYNTAIENTKKMLDELKVSTAGIIGTITELSNELTDADAIQTRYNSGLATGAKSIMDWAAGLDTARGSMDGTLGALGNVAEKMGVTLPDGIKMSVEEWKNYIEAQDSASESTQKALENIDKLGESLTSGLDSAIAEGGKGIKEAMKKLANDTGLEFNSDIRDALKEGEIATVLNDKLGKAVGLLSKASIRANPAAFDNIADQISQGTADAVERNPGLAAVGEKIQAALAKLKIDPNDPMAWKELTTNVALLNESGTLAGVGADKIATAQGNLNTVLGTSQTSLENVNTAFGTYKDTLGNIDLSNTEQAFQRIVSQAEAAQKAIRAYNDAIDASPAQMEASGDTRAVSDLEVAVGDKAIAEANAGGTAGPDMTAAKQSLEEYKTALAALPAQVTQVVTDSNAQFSLLGTPVDTVAAAILLKLVTALPGISTAVGTMVTDSNTSISTLMSPLESGPPAQSLAKYVVVLKALPTEVGTMVTTSNKSLDTLGTTLVSTVMPKILSTSTTTFQGVTSSAKTESEKIGPLYVTAEKALDTALKKSQTDAANTFQAITNIATSESKKIGPLFETAAKAVVTALGNMQTKAQAVFQSIVNSAEGAKGTVEDLADAINSLQDKTVTITTQYVTEGSPAATGFGPAVVDHPMNMKVGEAGPEYVAVIPLSSSAGKTMSPLERLAMYADPGRMRKKRETGSILARSAMPSSSSVMMATGTSFATSNTNSSSSSSKIVGGISSSITNILDRNQQQNNINNHTNKTISTGGYNSTSSIENISNGGGGGNNTIYNNGGGGSISSIISQLKDALVSAFGNTQINLTNINQYDSQTAYEMNKRQFQVRNGSQLR